MDELSLKLEKLKILEQEVKLREGLPHLYGWPWYKWAWEFFQSTNKENYLCAANQISKSSTAIRKCIEWATNPDLWPKLWETRPLTFWYLYPSKDVATIEFERKWAEEFLPRAEFKDHPQYGWKFEYDKSKMIRALHFNSGVSIYVKSYSQNPEDLQTGTVWAIFADEELPVDLYDELINRLAATDGFFHMIFTATLGQELWKEVIEGNKFPDAFKRQISLYDCTHYMDGSPSPWTKDRIIRREAHCSTEAERLKRIMGRFVKDDGLKYPAFDSRKNIKPNHPLPADWGIYAGVDIGSGGKSSHPAAIVFVGVSPDMKQGRVFKGWRGDGMETTASDILERYIELRGKMVINAAYYDWQAKDFLMIAARCGESFQPADKSHATGEQILSVLFKNEMLCIYDTEELKPLVHEIQTLQRNTPKTKAKDDFVDALRYCVSRIAWDFSWIQLEPDKAAPINSSLNKFGAVRGDDQSIEDKLALLIEDEIDGWNEMYET